MKTCRICKQSKALIDFYKDKNRSQGVDDRCKVCIAKYRKSINSPETTRNSHLKKTYGITIQDYNEMFAKQEGRCLICHRHQNELTQKLHVDHDHSTNLVRGLLCFNCNQALGNVSDSIDRLKAAIAYLEQHK